MEKRVIFLRIPKTASLSILDYLDGLGIEAVANPRGKVSHAPPERVKRRIGDDEWERLFKFSFVRNPWDRMVAYYHYDIYRNRIPSSREFKDWVLSPGYTTKAERPQASWYRFNTPKMDGGIGEWAVDWVGRYESLEADLRSKFPGGKLKRINRHTPKGASYRTYYDDETRLHVATFDHQVIKDFGYKF